MLVCPDCGCNEFTQRRTREVRLTISFLPGEHIIESDTVEVLAEDGADGYFECVDCCAEYYEPSELVDRDE